ncbi:MAG: S8 family serine peptidase [Candidatus Dormibacteria bacterium]
MIVQMCGEALKAGHFRSARTRRRLGPVIFVVLGALGALPWLAAEAYTAVPDDPFFAGHEQWALTGAPASVNAPEAWCVGSGAGVLIAVIDSGADFAHPDLAGKLVPGANFTSGGGDPQKPDGVGQAAVTDEIGHGTETTGIAVADTNNRIGIAAVAPDARALVMKVFKTTGAASPGDVFAAMRWSVDHGARVLNVSVDGLGEVAASGNGGIQAAMKYAIDHGVMTVFAAGNVPDTKADFSSVDAASLVVGGLGPNGQAAYYSAPGTRGVNIYAPGGDENQGAGPSDPVHNQVITTAMGGDYRAVEGTSAAAPVVAASLALLLGRGMSAVAARQAILGSAVTRYGLPELDVSRAIGHPQSCAPSPVVVASPRPAPRAGPTPGPSPGASISASPSPTASPRPTPSPTPSVVIVSPRSTAPPRAMAGLRLMVGGVGAGLLAVAGGLWFLARRRVAGSTRSSPPGR